MPKPGVRPRRWRWVYGIALGTVWLAIALGALFAWLASELPEPRAIKSFEPPETIRLEYVDRSPFVSLDASGGTAVSLQDLPPWLPQAVVAVEDHRFYRHGGVDLRGIARAFFVNARAGAVREGASTLTQQLAKNLFLGPERRLKRKAQEVMLALWLEQKLSKDEILELYLNRVYFGAGAYGVEAAARRYFGKPAAQVTLAEAAILAGLLKAPSRYAPTVNPAGARMRAETVLDRMVAAGLASAAEVSKAQLAAVVIRDAPVGGRYFADWVLDQVPDLVGSRNGSIVVVTTLDRAVQEAGDRSVSAYVKREGTAKGFSQAALVALEHDGAVRALVGGVDHATGPFNRALNAFRQPGSAFKPIVYLAGIEAGLEPSSVFIDGPIAIAGWRPSNFDGTFIGEVTLAEALSRSINTVAVQVAERAGRGRVAAAARRLGITSPMPTVPSLALGAAEVTPIELTGAYAAIANGGTGVWPYAITEIRDERDNVLYRREGSGPGPAMATTTAAKLTRMMIDVIARGTGRAAQLDRPAAGKTGTSQDYRDAWFLGFTADLTAGVWVGNDDNTPMNRVTGGDVPARIWRDFMIAAHRGKIVRDVIPAARTVPIEAVSAPKSFPAEVKLPPVVAQPGTSAEPPDARYGRGRD